MVEMNSYRKKWKSTMGDGLKRSPFLMHNFGKLHDVLDVQPSILLCIKIKLEFVQNLQDFKK